MLRLSPLAFGAKKKKKISVVFNCFIKKPLYICTRFSRELRDVFKGARE
jgi:hypothetical protein